MTHLRQDRAKRDAPVRVSSHPYVIQGLRHAQAHESVFRSCGFKGTLKQTIFRESGRCPRSHVPINFHRFFSYSGVNCSRQMYLEAIYMPRNNRTAQN
jgi:hypothetical protein